MQPSDQDLPDWQEGELLKLPMLDGQEFGVFADDYDDDDRPDDYDAALKNLLACDVSVLQAAQDHIYRYYQDMRESWDDEDMPEIASPADVWRHIEFGGEIELGRRAKDGLVYASLTCNCDWEPEHGLQIVLRNGQEVTKIGPYDGHYSQSDAFADDDLEGVVYRP
ncbi:Uncharacterised protein [Bordetella ansorpii]|uniref:DUF6985 domain-containing protein n=1 Tax=Bordetella ansorpii TaxID=288768 RepID=A0A157SH10_9BORD|nr:hypothetical protein [Bordetella ansorpii]SAI69501.1 Uncharacterised protein [Bordetella ansorpii]